MLASVVGRHKIPHSVCKVNLDNLKQFSRLNGGLLSCSSDPAAVRFDS